MKIMDIAFEEGLTFQIDNNLIKLIAFKTQEHGNIKFGVEAPRSVKVHREEIYEAIKQKEKHKLENNG